MNECRKSMLTRLYVKPLRASLPLGLAMLMISSHPLSVHAQPPDRTPGNIVPGLLLEMRAKKISPQMAWDNQLLDIEGVKYALADSNLLSDEEAKKFVRLLMDNCDDCLKAPTKILPDGRLRIARLLREYRDPRGVSLIEENLATITKPVARGEERFPYYNLMELGGYYRDIGQPAKEIETMLSAKKYMSNPEHLANMVAVAANSARDMGNAKYADELEASIPSYGYGWATGITYLHQAGRLSAGGKIEEARKVASLPSPGRYGDQARLHLLMWLANSYLSTGDVEQARQYAEQAARLYPNLAEPPIDEVKYIEKSARQFLERLDKTTRQPLQCEPRALNIVGLMPSPGGTPRSIRRLLSVRIPRPAAISAGTDNPGVSIQVIGKPVRDNEFFVQMIAVIIAPSAQQKTWQDVLLIKSPDLPNQELKIPISFEPRKPTA